MNEQLNNETSLLNKKIKVSILAFFYAFNVVFDFSGGWKRRSSV